MELRELFKEPDVVCEFKWRRIRWAGHVLRREESSKLKKVIIRNPEGRRPKGRPMQKWWNQVKADLERLGATEEDAEDRERWRHLVGEAKNLLGFVWPQE